MVGRALLAVVAVVSLIAAGSTLAQDGAPDVLVKTVTLEIIDLIAKDKDLQSGDQKKIVAVIESKILPHFNFAAMTRLAVATNWEKSTAEQRKQLTEEFKTLLVRTYSSALSTYRNQRFDFRPLRAKPTDTDVTVQVKISQGSREAVSLEYDMEKTPYGWKVYDVRIAGVSLVASYRTEFANEIRAHGVDGLIKSLVAKNQGQGLRAERR
ncbi:MAG TPA: ABC transporter substrate-binding protein [Pyrinomonadaceae bacterium]|nr:ABC transporter substrate-binding protein [Pyrinomonadaceae bacterium]